MLINIFLGLCETDIVSCRLVCRRWFVVASDKTLVYYSRRQDLPLAQLIIESCEQNNIISFTKSVAAYCAFDNILTARTVSSHDLWVKCMIAAAKGGSLQILKKIFGYGPSYGFADAIRIAVEHGHENCAALLRKEKAACSWLV